MTTRAVTLLKIKRASGDGLSFTGWASTVDIDRMGDQVEPRGAKFELPIPLLWAHDHKQPIGTVTDATVTAKGIRVAFSLVPEVAKSREAAALIAVGALALSVGFQVLESEPLPGGGFRFTQWSWYELSLVSVPANESAKIDRVGKGLAVVDAPRTEVGPSDYALQRRNSEPWMSVDEQMDLYYERFNLAVNLLPERMRKLTDVGRCLEHRGSMTFSDSFGNEIATVDQDGRVIYPVKAMPKPVNQEKQSAPSIPKAYKDLLFAAAKKVNDLDDLLAIVVKRIKTLEKKDVGRALDVEVVESMVDLSERLDRIEVKVKEVADMGIRYLGFWRREQRYERGDAVTWDGSIWRAVQASTGDPPNSETSSWCIAVRKGSNGKKA